MIKRFPEILKKEIQKGLPGTEVQWQMASSDRLIRNFPKTPLKNTREAAVLILLYPNDGDIYTVFTQRHNYDGVHGGQISFPGGKREDSDNDLIQTAVREAQEETRVDPESVKIIGTLTPLFIPVSNMIVTPVVAWTDKQPVFKHQPEEVVFLIHAVMRKLMDPAIVKIKPFEIRGEMLDIKYFDYEGNVIWGATAMILHELHTIIRASELKTLNFNTNPEC